MPETMFEQRQTLPSYTFVHQCWTSYLKITSIADDTLLVVKVIKSLYSSFTYCILVPSKSNNSKSSTATRHILYLTHVAKENMLGLRLTVLYIIDFFFSLLIV